MRGGELQGPYPLREGEPFYLAGEFEKICFYELFLNNFTLMFLMDDDILDIVTRGNCEYLV